MTIRLGVLPYGPSDSCRALRDALVAAFADNARVTPRMIRAENSAFQGRGEDVIVNYGNRSAPATVFGRATVLNPQASLNNAANKITALQVMQHAGVSTVPWTARIGEAQQWVEAGETVYARATLTGHSGDGITVHRNRDEILPQVPLYTKAITGQRREWRVHIFKGVITYVQVKRRANGYQDNPNYQEDVRNHHTGWIYATENINPTDAVLRNAALAVAALGLDFGAVDIISRRDEVWVLEVNTAPGLTGTTLETFTRNVVEYVNSRQAGRAAQYVARFQVPAAPAEPTVSAEATATAEPVEEQTTANHVVPNVPNAGDVPFGRQEVQHSGRRSTSGDGAREDGYYLATVTNQDGGVSYRAILWVSNGRWYRHGWNHPIESSRITQIRQLGSVTVVGGEVINLDFATQE